MPGLFYGGDGMATDLRRLIRKLQQALAIQQGRHISLSTYQVYSTKAGRTCTKYILSEQRQDGEKRAYKKMLESWSLPEIVKALANELQGGKQPDASTPGENTTPDSTARQKGTEQPSRAYIGDRQPGRDAEAGQSIAPGEGHDLKKNHQTEAGDTTKASTATPKKPRTKKNQNEVTTG